MVNTICKAHGFPQGEIECGCDGEGAIINKVFSEQEDANTDGSQFDLLSTTRAAIKSSPIQWKFRHVKGHQDNIRDAILDRWVLLNIEMDSLAKMHWLEKSEQQQPLNSLSTGIFWPSLATNCTQTFEFVGRGHFFFVFFRFIYLKNLYTYIVWLHIVPNRQTLVF